MLNSSIVISPLVLFSGKVNKAVRRTYHIFCQFKSLLALTPFAILQKIRYTDGGRQRAKNFSRSIFMARLKKFCITSAIPLKTFSKIGCKNFSSVLYFICDKSLKPMTFRRTCHAFSEFNRVAIQVPLQLRRVGGPFSSECAIYITLVFRIA